MAAEKNTIKRKYIIRYLMIFGSILGIYFLSRLTKVGIDLTEENRYTISKSSEDIINKFDEPVFVKIMLDGKFPAGFKRLQTASIDLLDRFKKINSNISYTIESPLGEDQKAAEQLKLELSKQGVVPVNLILKGSNEKSTSLIYPYAEVTYGAKKMFINLLEGQKLEGSDQEALNNSVALLEYKFVNALQKMHYPSRKNIVYSRGHGELNDLELSGINKQLSPFFNIYYANLDSTYKISKHVDLVVIARPRGAFSEKEKFVIDQYIMNGGNVIFLVDKMNAAIDSIQMNSGFVPSEYDLNLDDLLFKYGCRIQPNFVRDLECSKIPMVVGKVGDNIQTELFDYYYHLIPAPACGHPIVKNLDRVNLLFPSSIDTVRTKNPILKTVLLKSSAYTSLQYLPTRLDFEILRYPPDVSKFNKAPANLAVLLEGNFSSLYQSRVPALMQESLSNMKASFLPEGKPAKVLVVSDGEIARSHINRATGEVQPLGFNRFERYTYDNQAFMINAIEYMMDDDGILQSRAKDVKLRLLDYKEIKQNALFWQIFNVILPLILLGLGYWGYHVYRKRKYAFN